MLSNKNNKTTSGLLLSNPKTIIQSFMKSTPQDNDNENDNDNDSDATTSQNGDNEHDNDKTRTVERRLDIISEFFDFVAGRLPGESNGRDVKTQMIFQEFNENSETLPKSRRRVVPQIVLPFCGKIVPYQCFGIRENHRLYTQCAYRRPKNKLYCSTCERQASRNAGGKPNYGDIRERHLSKLPEIKYNIVMKSLEYTREQVVEEAAKFGWTVPEYHFEEYIMREGDKKISLKKNTKKRPRASGDGEENDDDDNDDGRSVAATTIADDDYDDVEDVDVEVAEEKANDGEEEQEDDDESVAETVIVMENIRKKEKKEQNKSKESSTKKLKETPTPTPTPMPTVDEPPKTPTKNSEEKSTVTPPMTTIKIQKPKKATNKKEKAFDSEEDNDKFEKEWIFVTFEEVEDDPSTHKKMCVRPHVIDGKEYFVEMHTHKIFDSEEATHVGTYNRGKYEFFTLPNNK